MRINTNINSMTTQESSTANNASLSSSLEKLSSGLKVNKASDNASGMAIADKLRTQKNSIGQSIDNANSAVAMLQIADKAMAEQSIILDIVKTKLVQASTATTSDDGRKSIAKDINKLLTELDGIASQTNYNGKTLLQESTSSQESASALEFQLGEKANDTVKTTGSIQANTKGLAKSSPTDDLADLKTDTSGDGSGLTKDRSSTYLAIIDLALNDLNTMRSDFGSTQIQVESSTRNLLTAKTNIAAAESVIRDVDYSEETAHLQQLSLIGKASTYAQSQANAHPQTILKLLN
jgi:flagellin